MQRRLPSPRVVAALAAAVVAACTDAPTGTVAPKDAATPPLFEVAPGISAVTNVAYATRSPAEKLDIYTPTSGPKPYPVIVWVHGGGWSMGDKSLASTSIQLKLLPAGIAVVSVNYRLSGEAIFPAQIQDIKAAVRWIRAHAGTYNLNPNRIGAWGLSAGGHLVELLGTSSGVTALTDLSLGNGGQPDNVKTVVSWAGAVNFLTLDSQLSSNGCPVFGGSGHNAPTSPPSLLMGAPIQTIPSKVLAAGARAYVGPGDAKFLLQHGKLDCTIPYQQSQALYGRLTSVLGAGQAQLDLFPTAKHGGPDFNSPANATRIINYLKATL